MSGMDWVVPAVADAFEQPAHRPGFSSFWNCDELVNTMLRLMAAARLLSGREKGVHAQA